MTIAAVGIDPGVRHVGIAFIELGSPRPRQSSTWVIRHHELGGAIRGLARHIGEMAIPDVTGVEYIAAVQHGQTMSGRNSFAASLIREAAGGAFGAAAALMMNPIWVTPAEWRSQLGITSNAPKDAARAALSLRFDDVSSMSEHEVDALAIALRAANVERVRLGSEKQAF